MIDSTAEVEIVRLGVTSVEQIQEVIKNVEADLATHGDGASDLIRPLSKLLDKLMEAQVSVEGLIEKLYSVDAVAVG